MEFWYVEVICPTSKSQGCLRESVLRGSPSPSTHLAIPDYYGALVIPSWDFFLNQPLRFLDIMCVLHGLVTPLPRVPPMITSCECWKRCGARCSNQRDHFLSRGKSSPNSFDGDNDDNDIIEIKVVRGRRNDERGQDIHKKCSPKVNNDAL